jgi:hypothetical protein
MPEIIDYTKSKGVFKDTGEGDVDFYTYWFSVCYVVGMMNVYRRIFRDVEDYETVVRKFLTSRGIAFVNSSNIDLLTTIYNNFTSEIEKRGTSRINDFLGKSLEIGVDGVTKNDTIANDVAKYSGVGVLSNAIDLIGDMGSSIALSNYHSIKFDCYLSDSDGVQYAVGTGGTEGKLFHNATNGVYLVSLTAPDAHSVASYGIVYLCNSVAHTFTASMNTLQLNTIKILRAGAIVALYVNDVLIDTDVVTASDSYTLSYIFSNGLPVIANIEISAKTSAFQTIDTYIWSCSEGSGCTIQSNHAPDNSIKLHMSDDTAWDTVWIRQPLFANTDYIGYDGEVRRSVDYSSGECLLELAATAELGLAVDMSSPLSEEASCKNLNKAFQRGIITKLSNHPLNFSAAVLPSLINEYIVYDIPNYNNTLFGINAPLVTNKDWRTNAKYKPVGQIPFIPINVASTPDVIDGYEISFVIQASTNIDLKFGIATYDADLNLLVNKTKRYTDAANSDMFWEVTDLVLCKNRDLWVRGIYSLAHMTTADHKLNIGFGNNLYNNSTGLVKYIAPIITFIASDYYQTTVMLKDIVVRPLSLNTSKGQVSNKNTMIGFLRNDSGRSDLDVTKFIEQKLIPYNCTTNIQYL